MISAAELWVDNRAEEIRNESPTVPADEAEARARRESFAGLCPYREVDESLDLEPFDDWLWRME